MNIRTFSYAQEGVSIQLSHTGNKDTYNEFYAYFHIDNPTHKAYGVQQDALFQAFNHLQKEELLKGAVPVFARFYLSDTANHAAALKEALKNEGTDTAFSIIEQPPLDGSKISLWVYFASKVTPFKDEDFQGFISPDGTRHYWWVGPQINECSSEHQARMLLEYYQLALKRHDMSIKDNCLRTWFYVQNIDVNYAGMSKARNEFFKTCGLNARTHYITSTGIQGRSADYHVSVRLDAYAAKGIPLKNIQYLDAREYLSPTRIYDVTFERGVCVHLSDRNKYYISGTASIDKDGNVMYVGDIEKQTERMLLNVEKLLEEGGANLKDLAFATVYLRDPSDEPSVRRILDERLAGIPRVILYAPVCRPTWLIEMECIAVK